MGAESRPWGRCQDRGGVAKAVRVVAKTEGAGPRLWGMAKALGEAAKPWGCCQDCEGVARPW